MYTALCVSIEKVHGLQNAEKDDLTFPEWWALIEGDATLIYWSQAKNCFVAFFWILCSINCWVIGRREGRSEQTCHLPPCNMATPHVDISCVRVAILRVAIPRMALHETCLFHATRKRGPRKHVTGIFIDFSWHHTWIFKENEVIIERYCS